MATPDTIATLYAWYRTADESYGVSDGDTVSTCTDQSGNGRDGTTATGTSQDPHWRSGANGINGYPVWEFKAGTFERFNVTGLSLTQPATIAVVFRLNSSIASTQQVMVTVGSTASDDMRVYSIDNPLRIFAGSGGIEGTVSLADLGDHYGVAVFDGLSSLLRTDGGDEQTGDPGSEPVTGSELVIGANQNNDFELDGVIAEVVVYDTRLSSAQIADLEQYFEDRYFSGTAVASVTAAASVSANPTVEGGAVASVFVLANVLATGSVVGSVEGRASVSAVATASAVGSGPVSAQASISTSVTVSGNAGLGVVSIEVDGSPIRFRVGSLRIRRRINDRSTASFEVVDKTGTLSAPEWRSPVNITFQGKTLFDGWIDSVDEEATYVSGGVADAKLLQIDCIDHHYLADKRVITGEWENTLAGDIVREILAGTLQHEGVTNDTIEDGILLERYVADHKAASEVLEDLSGMSGYIWLIDFSRGLHFRRRDLVAAAVVGQGTGMLRGSVKVRRRNPSYRNKQHVIGAEKDAEDTGRGATTEEEQATWGAAGQPDLWGSFDDPATSSKYGHRFEYHAGNIRNVFFVGEGDNPHQSGTMTEKSVAADTESPLPDADWYYERLGDVIWRNPSRPNPTDAYFRVDMERPQAINDQTFDGDGSTREWETIRPFGSQNEPRIEVFRNSTGDWTVQTVAKEGSGDTAQFFYTPFVNIFRQDSGETVLGANDQVRVRWIEEGVADALYSDTDEIAAQKAREGGTTTGIVEHVVANHQAETLGELQSIAAGELNRWAHNTIEVEYQTWDSRLAEGETQTINLPEFGISSEDFLVDEVRIRDHPTQGAIDQKDSPIMLTISVVRSPDLGATGGSFGRAGNPARISDLFRQLNDPVRLNRPIEDVFVADVTPERFAGSLVGVTRATGVGSLIEGAAVTPATLGADLWCEGDDAPSGNFDIWPNRIGTDNPVGGFGTNSVGPVLNGHDVVDFPSFDSEGGHNWFETSANWPNAATTIMVVARVDYDPSFSADANIAFTNNLWLRIDDNVGRYFVRDVDVTEIGTTSGPGLNVWALFTAIIDGANSVLRIDGTEVASGTLANNTGSEDTFQFGNFDQYGGQIAAIAGWQSAVTGSDLTDAEGYFIDRFAL